ncbi:MAG: hypothetical protein HY738_07480 [Bacteroidia bacterium]|nr:hypothetical protein [Bacteroidia bacterium]
MKKKELYNILSLQKVVAFLAISTVSSFLLTMCNDIFEKNLEKKTVTLISPYNGMITEQLSILFWWEELDGADSYQLQVVTPSFDSIQRLMLDTNLTTNIFQHTFSPGNFQWRVKAFNSAYETLYSTWSFTIDSSNSLSGQTVILKSPADNYITNDTSLNFSWYPLLNATSYRFEINNESSLLFSINLDTTAVTIPYYNSDNIMLCPAFDEGGFTWCVQAYNEISQSISSARSFIVDTTAPPTPTLIYPSDNALINDSLVTLSWQRGACSGTSVRDSLYIFGDSLLTNLKLSTRTTDTTYQYSIPAAGSYFWFLISIDAAANSSDYTNIRKFRHEE